MTSATPDLLTWDKAQHRQASAHLRDAESAGIGAAEGPASRRFVSLGADSARF